MSVLEKGGVQADGIVFFFRIGGFFGKGGVCGRENGSGCVCRSLEGWEMVGERFWDVVDGGGWVW